MRSLIVVTAGLLLVVLLLTGAAPGYARGELASVTIRYVVQPEEEPGGGGAGGSASSGGGNGGEARVGADSNASAAPGSMVTIQEDAVPLADGVVEIIDGDVPLGALPKTGRTGQSKTVQ